MKKIPATKAKVKFGKIFLNATKEPLIITKHNQNMLVVLSYTLYKKMTKFIVNTQKNKIKKEEKSEKNGQND